MNNLAEIPAQLYSERVGKLLQPISEQTSAGNDLSYSTLFDDIRDARRSDDPGLTQGQWATEVKTADWNRVRNLCESAFQTQTKDFQLAAWYTEALVNLEGFRGLTEGLVLINGLISQYWYVGFPLLDGDDASERAAKFEWLNTQLPFALKSIPLTSAVHGNYSWLQWEESRWVENIGLRDIKAKADAIADGKLAGEAFDKAAKQSGKAFYEPLVADVHGAVNALDTLIEQVDAQFGADAPSLIDMRAVLTSCAALVDKLLMEITGRPPAISTSNTEQVALPQTASVAHNTGVKTVGVLQNRNDAIQSLRDVAQYFRINEPQSPVALLAERAARWAEMSMDEWLAAVIKDDGTLSQLRELLDISSPA